MVGVVLGAYRITSEIATGGMGTVYRAEHTLLGRPAAIKLLRPELTANDELVQRFFNEAKAATAIRHGGIVEVYDFGYTTAGHAYLVMELLEGKTLAKGLADVGRYGEIEAATIARGIASALKAAHGKGIIHRDLKPDNVFLVPDLEGPTGSTRVKVLDFGIAKLADISPTNHHQTQTGALMGTPLYMAPEQARAAGSIDHRADLYSLGCILYELLVGEPPFNAVGAGEIIALQLFGEVVPPSDRVPGITSEMNQIVLRLLAKEPRERFQTSADLGAALDTVGAQMSGRFAMQVSTTSSTRVRVQPGEIRMTHADEAPQAAKRSTMPILAGVVTAVLAAGTVAFVMTRSSDDPTPVAPAEVKPRPEPMREPARKPDPPIAVQQAAPLMPPPLAIPKYTPVKDPKIPVKDPKVPKQPVTPVVGGPVTHPTRTPDGPVTTTKGPTTSEGSPIETSLDDNKKEPK